MLSVILFTVLQTVMRKPVGGELSRSSLKRVMANGLLSFCMDVVVLSLEYFVKF